MDRINRITLDGAQDTLEDKDKSCGRQGLLVSHLVPEQLGEIRKPAACEGGSFPGLESKGSY